MGSLDDYFLQVVKQAKTENSAKICARACRDKFLEPNPCMDLPIKIISRILSQGNLSDKDARLISEVCNSSVRILGYSGFITSVLDVVAGLYKNSQKNISLSLEMSGYHMNILCSRGLLQQPGLFIAFSVFDKGRSKGL